jgi:hypothetical protein
MEHRMARTPLGDFVSTPTRDLETTLSRIFFGTFTGKERLMERSSDKHAPRLDDELKQELRSILQGSPVEARANESREQEGPADGEPTPDALLTGGRTPATPDALSHDEVEARTELARHLQPSIFPADRETLIASARRSGAGDELVDQLGNLPDGTFDHLEAVWEALGGRVEYRP